MADAESEGSNGRLAGRWSEGGAGAGGTVGEGPTWCPGHGGGLHPGAHGRERVSHRENGLWGQALLHRHGHHDWRGAGGGQLGVHLLQMRGRPGAVFRGEHEVLLLLLEVEVAGCGGRRKGGSDGPGGPAWSLLPGLGKKLRRARWRAGRRAGPYP